MSLSINTAQPVEMDGGVHNTFPYLQVSSKSSTKHRVGRWDFTECALFCKGFMFSRRSGHADKQGLGFSVSSGIMKFNSNKISTKAAFKRDHGELMWLPNADKRG